MMKLLFACFLLVTACWSSPVSFCDISLMTIETGTKNCTINNKRVTRKVWIRPCDFSMTCMEASVEGCFGEGKILCYTFKPRECKALVKVIADESARVFCRE